MYTETIRLTILRSISGSSIYHPSRFPLKTEISPSFSRIHTPTHLILRLPVLTLNDNLLNSYPASSDLLHGNRTLTTIDYSFGQPSDLTQRS